MGEQKVRKNALNSSFSSVEVVSLFRQVLKGASALR